MAPLYYSTTQELFQQSKEGQKWIHSISKLPTPKARNKLGLLSCTSTNFPFIKGSCFDLCLELDSSQLVSFVLPQPWLWAQVHYLMDKSKSYNIHGDIHNGQSKLSFSVILCQENVFVTQIVSDPHVDK